ncbi:response regulator transcription factor [Labrys miyagiensis]|uniref:response regulator transcription factor n=1 Tax=Labrys miyagiensis TaxID=346912 RepID=UPI0024E04F44|nr:response regulator transcription factor [Labrys miyagiensis]
MPNHRLTVNSSNITKEDSLVLLQNLREEILRLGSIDLSTVTGGPASKLQVMSDPSLPAPSHLPGQSNGGSMVASSPVGPIVLINNRALQRDCLGRVLAAEFPQRRVLTFASIDDWNAVADQETATPLVFLCDSDTALDLDALGVGTALWQMAPVILLSDAEDPASIFRALDMGIKGYIPSSLGIEVAIEATRLVMAGGVFVPAASLIRAANEPSAPRPELASRPHTPISPRQLSIIAAVSRGKSNAAIADELNLRESTVKVHIRNIMKKLKVKSRTAIAHKSRDILRAQGYEIYNTPDAGRPPLGTGIKVS